MLAREPEQRYQSVHEVRTNLAHLLTETGAPAAPQPVPAKKAVPTALWVSLAAAGVVLVLGLLWSQGVFQRTAQPPVDVATAREDPPRIPAQQSRLISLARSPKISSLPPPPWRRNGIREVPQPKA